MLIKTKNEKNEIDVISTKIFSYSDFDDVVLLIICKMSGRVIKKTYIPDNRWVIDIKADMGNLILVRSRYTGLSCIVCLITNFNN